MTTPDAPSAADTAPFDSQSLGRRLNELVLLALLRRAPMHGYQVAAEAEERSGGFFSFSHGTLYPILHRLEKEGLIAGEWSDPAEGRSRKEYALTRAGETYLEAGIRHWQAVDAHLARIVGREETKAPPSRTNDEQIRGGAA